MPQRHWQFSLDFQLAKSVSRDYHVIQSLALSTKSCYIGLLYMRVGRCKSEQSKEHFNIFKQPHQYPKALLTSGSCFHGTLYIFSFFLPRRRPIEASPCRLVPFCSQSLLDRSSRQHPRGVFAVDESLSGSRSMRIVAWPPPHLLARSGALLYGQESTTARR